jgi:hypothetical protein
MLDLIGLNGKFFAAPDIACQACFHTQPGQKILWSWQLIPDLGQKGGAAMAHSDRNTVHPGPQLGKQIKAIAVGKWLRFGEDAYFNIDFLKGCTDSIAFYTVAYCLGVTQAADATPQLAAYM